MKAEELAMIINEIDEDMVEDAWTENGTTIIISESIPLSFWKVTAAAAACFVAVIAGVFCFTIPKHEEPVPSYPADSSYSESDTSPTLVEDNIILYDEAHTDNKFFAEKLNDNNFAMLNIEETNATAENPAFITIYDSDGKAVTETVRIIGSGRYGVYYRQQWSMEDTCCLTVSGLPEGIVLKGTWTP